MQWSTMSGFMQDISLMKVNKTELTPRLPQLASSESATHIVDWKCNRPQEDLLVQRLMLNGPGSCYLPEQQ